MTENRIGSMDTGSAEITDYSISAVDTGGPTGHGKTTYINSDWGKQLASYREHPEIAKVIDALGIWIIGKGLKTDPETQFLCDSIRGNGNDTFNTIIRNQFVVSEIGGDSYAEIIRDDKGNLINVKPLDPGSIQIVSGENGMIEGYEQISKTKKWIFFKRKNKPFTPDKILHFSRNRCADSIGGQSLVKILTWLIEAKHEAITDYRVVQHWNVKPRWKHRLKTDDPTEIAAYKTKMDKNKATGEDIYEPYDVCESELISVAPNATMNPMTWIQYLDNQFYEQSGVPRIIVGGSSEFVEKATTVVYLAFQQTVEAKQLYIEEQIGQQLGLMIELEFPASLENELISDQKKDGDINIDEGKTKIGQTGE